MGEPSRFSSIKKAVSYCGLSSALRESAGVQKHGPLSKQRNRHLQSVLIEATKIGVMYHPRLREIYDRAREKGHANRATLQVARKLVAYLLAADRFKTCPRRASAQSPLFATEAGESPFPLDK